MVKLDREAFLLCATALAACHAEHRRVADAERPPVTRPKTPTEVSASLLAAESDAGASDAGEASSPAPGLLDTSSASGDAGDAGAEATSTDAASSTANPPPSAAELRRRCAALREPDPECRNLREEMCRTALREYAPVAAGRAVDCLERVGSSCDTCGIRVCLKTALEGLPPNPVARCEGVRKAANAQSDESYGNHMFELCTRYASGMTPTGRARFTSCLKKNMGIGIRFCLWDPSVTPCTERSGPTRESPYD